MARKPKDESQKCKNRNASTALRKNTEPIADALDRVWVWWLNEEVLDDLAVEELHDHRNAITDACRSLAVDTVGDLFGEAATIIATAARASSLVLNTGTEAAHRLHRTRNVLAALLWTLSWSAGHNPCSVIEDLPTLLRRPGGKNRRVHDDEILLLRLRAIYRLHRTRRFLAAGIMYAVTEGGAWPVETTRLVIGDFDNPARPRTVKIRDEAARADTVARQIAIPGWAQRALPHALARFTGPGRLSAQCVFAGDSANQKNSPSIVATQSLTRAMNDMGIDDNLVATEPVYWRAATIARTRGIPAAARQIGWVDENAVERLTPHVHRYNPPVTNRPTQSFEGF